MTLHGDKLISHNGLCTVLCGHNYGMPLQTFRVVPLVRVKMSKSITAAAAILLLIWQTVCVVQVTGYRYYPLGVYYHFHACMNSICVCSDTVGLM